MKILIIGGTGTLSCDITNLCISRGDDVYLLNRGNGNSRVYRDAKIIKADVYDTEDVRQKLSNLSFDIVIDFIAFTPAHVNRDIELFLDKCAQFIFISTASIYKKKTGIITESTPLYNPFWQYSRDKIACEETLMHAFRDKGFPVTVVRPSHTYDLRSLPIGVHGKFGSFQPIRRIIEDKPVLVPGDGSSLWTVTNSQDFAEFFYGIIGNPRAIGEAVHITSDEALSWDEIYDTIGAILGKPVKKLHVSSHFLAACDPFYEGSLIGDKANTFVFDNSKIKDMVPGVSCKIPFYKGAAMSLQHILTHEECMPEDAEFDSFSDRVALCIAGAVDSVKSADL